MIEERGRDRARKRQAGLWRPRGCSTNAAFTRHRSANLTDRSADSIPPAPQKDHFSAGAARWRSGYAEDCKSLHAGSIPARASTQFRDLYQSLSLFRKRRDSAGFQRFRRHSSVSWRRIKTGFWGQMTQSLCGLWACQCGGPIAAPDVRSSTSYQKGNSTQSGPDTSAQTRSGP